MIPLQELRFAQSYPFSLTAQTVVKNSGISLESVPKAILQRARILLSSALEGRDYNLTVHEDSELIMNEILAFPVAKILLSFSKNSSYFDRFAEFVAEMSFKRLELERNEILFDLAQELGLKFGLPEEKESFAEVPAVEFLRIPHHYAGMHLVNLGLSKGRVFLSQSEFARFIADAVRLKVFQSLPLKPEDLKKMPSQFKKEALDVFSEHSARQKKAIALALSGKIEVESFPPCFSELYSRLSSGEQLSHYGNFTLASFLIAIQMPRDQIMNVFRKAPNFDERVAGYHIDRMSRGKKYTPASCSTMRSYALCIQNGELCPNIKNPLQYYRRKLYSGSARIQKQPEKEAGK